MLSKVHSGAVYGVDAYPVEIEVNSGRGDAPSPSLWSTSPQTVIVGLPDAAVKEIPSTGSTVLTTGLLPPLRNRYGGQAGSATLRLSSGFSTRIGFILEINVALTGIA